MAKATLQFDLSDPEDMRAHKHAIQGETYYFQIWELDQELRKITKYGNIPDKIMSEIVEHMAATEEKNYENTNRAVVEICAAYFRQQLHELVLSKAEE